MQSLELKMATKLWDKVKENYPLVCKACSNSNNADQMVEAIVKTELLVKQATNEIIDEIRKAHCQSFHLQKPRLIN